MEYNIALWSGGKDSTAQVILDHQSGNPRFNLILMSEVVFSYGYNPYISGENPQHLEFCVKIAKPLFESWGYDVKIVRSKRDYISEFERIIENPRKVMEHKGKKYGFPVFGKCQIKRDLKFKPIDDYLKSLERQGHAIRRYCGICSDEKKRLASLGKLNNSFSILGELGITQQQTRKICEENNLLSPCYTLEGANLCRQGCWMCPNAKPEESRYIKENYPDVWQKFVSLEEESNVAFDKWNIYGETLHERDARI